MTGEEAFLYAVERARRCVLVRVCLFEGRGEGQVSSGCPKGRCWQLCPTKKTGTFKCILHISYHSYPNISCPGDASSAVNLDLGKESTTVFHAVKMPRERYVGSFRWHELLLGAYDDLYARMSRTAPEPAELCRGRLDAWLPVRRTGQALSARSALSALSAPFALQSPTSSCSRCADESHVSRPPSFPVRPAISSR